MTFVINPFRFVAGVITYTTWNAADKSSEVTLSNSDKTVTRTTGDGFYRGVRAFKANRSKFYFEGTLNNTGTAYGVTIGVGTSTAYLSSYLGQSSNTVGVYTDGGTVRVWHDGGNYENWSATFSFPARFRVAVDAPSKKIWFAYAGGNWNGDASADPETGTGGITHGATNANWIIAETYYNGDEVVLYADPSDWTYTAPSGFSAAIR